MARYTNNYCGYGREECYAIIPYFRYRAHSEAIVFV